ncbi:rhodanese-like domain-containing protein [Lutibacter sp. B1]|uniref:rhodanese-like domain-containing protein n=1 Tax=Lutibacter sp. B1 TaxID=2725996 RepID=UPI00145795E5|nr:rhodanese-like domain-containing protein [Lutibacter sp. B1]NLP58216.1 hypothetical protein [Lutibacter sp. B1]
MINRNLVKVLSFRYPIIAAIFLILAGGLVLLPKYEKQKGIAPQELLNKSTSPERYISTDQLADIIINQDPSYIFVDVRDEESFNKYTLPNAVNIPLKQLFDEDLVMYLNQDQFDVVLFSNDNFYADQAWILCNRLKYKNLHVLKGGLNEWYNTIINPPFPNENMPAQDFELFSARKAASMYFGVAYPEQAKKEVKAPIKTAPKKIVPVKKKKKMPVEGGC